MHASSASRFASVLTSLIIASFLQLGPPLHVASQDLLRQRIGTSNQAPQQQANNDQANLLANIQLPPQLASLTPQQLHQLARLREIQIEQQQKQQAAQQQQNQRSNQDVERNQQLAPAPIGMEAAPQQPTATPVSANSGQIPQPNLSSSAAPSSAAPLDTGAYTESGAEQDGVSQPASGANSDPNGANSAPAAPTFEVNWNKCPQLEPSDHEKSKKTQVITKCLQSAPIPANLTRENVENHREQIATCALKVEGWFDDQGNYKYDKAESEIRAKKLEGAIELQVLKFHVACKDEASKKFPRDQNKLIDQVQFYQACMDYYISIVCEIEVSVDQ